MRFRPQLAHTARRPLLAHRSLTEQKGAKRQPKGKPDRTKGLADSPESSLRRRLFYGQADPVAHSSAKTQTFELNEFMSADSQTQIILR